MRTSSDHQIGVELGEAALRSCGLSTAATRRCRRPPGSWSVPPAGGRGPRRRRLARHLQPHRRRTPGRAVDGPLYRRRPRSRRATPASPPRPPCRRRRARRRRPRPAAFARRGRSETMTRVAPRVLDGVGEALGDGEVRRGLHRRGQPVGQVGDDGHRDGQLQGEGLDGAGSPRSARTGGWMPRTTRAQVVERATVVWRASRSNAAASSGSRWMQVLGQTDVHAQRGDPGLGPSCRSRSSRRSSAAEWSTVSARDGSPPSTRSRSASVALRPSRRRSTRARARAPARRRSTRPPPRPGRAAAGTTTPAEPERHREVGQHGGERQHQHARHHEAAGDEKARNARSRHRAGSRSQVQTTLSSGWPAVGGRRLDDLLAEQPSGQRPVARR